MAGARRKVSKPKRDKRLKEGKTRHPLHNKDLDFSSPIVKDAEDFYICGFEETSRDGKSRFCTKLFYKDARAASQHKAVHADEEFLDKCLIHNATLLYHTNVIYHYSRYHNEQRLTGAKLDAAIKSFKENPSLFRRGKRRKRSKVLTLQEFLQNERVKKYITDLQPSSATVSSTATDHDPQPSLVCTNSSSPSAEVVSGGSTASISDNSNQSILGRLCARPETCIPKSVPGPSVSVTNLQTELEKLKTVEQDQALQIATLTTQLETRATEVHDLLASSKNLQDTLSKELENFNNIKNERDQLAGEVRDLKTRLETNLNANKEHIAQITNLEDQKSKLEAANKDLQGNVIQLREQLDKLKSTENYLKALVLTHENQLAAKTEEIQTLVDAHQQQVSTLHRNMDELDEKWNAAEKRIDELKAENADNQYWRSTYLESLTKLADLCKELKAKNIIRGKWPNIEIVHRESQDPTLSDTEQLKRPNDRPVRWWPCAWTKDKNIKRVNLDSFVDDKFHVINMDKFIEKFFDQSHKDLRQLLFRMASVKSSSDKNKKERSKLDFGNVRPWGYSLQKKERRLYLWLLNGYLDPNYERKIDTVLESGRKILKGDARPAIIDGANVGFTHAKKFCPDHRENSPAWRNSFFQGIWKVVEFFRGYQHDPVVGVPFVQVVLSEKWQYRREFEKSGEKYYTRGTEEYFLRFCGYDKILWIPAYLEELEDGETTWRSVHDDPFIIDAAAAAGGFIVSGDKFRDNRVKWPNWGHIMNRRVSVSFNDNGVFQPGCTLGKGKRYVEVLFFQETPGIDYCENPVDHTNDMLVDNLRYDD